MANFSDNFNKTIAKGYNVFGQARALGNALGILAGPQQKQSISKDVASEIRKNGVARPTYAYTQIITPPVMQKFKSKTNSRNFDHSFLTYRNDSFSMPGISLATNEFRRYGYGPVEKKPYGVVYQDVTFNYILDTSYNQHRFFYNWMDGIVAHSLGRPSNAGKNRFNMSAYEVAYKKEYATPIYIHYFDDRFDGSDELQPMYAVLEDAFPIFIGDIQYNWGGTDTLIRLPVTFTYQSWSTFSPNDVTADLEVVQGNGLGLFGSLLKVGTAVQALSNLKTPRNIQDVVNLTNVTRTLR